MDTLYVSDLDGTLLSGDSRISQDSLDIINGLIARGLPFTYATARSFTSAQVVTAGLQLRLDAIIYNGAMSADTSTGETHDRLALSNEIIATVRALMAQAHAPLPVVYTFVSGIERVLYAADSVTPQMARYISSRAGDPRFCALNDPAAIFDGDIFYITFMGTREQLFTLHEKVRSMDCVVLFQKELGTADEYWLEIMPAGATKAAAIQRMQRRLGLSRVVCFGDYPNDASMFAIADEAYAVGNAVDSLKSIATGIIGDNCHDGVALFLKKRFENLADI